MVHKLRSIKLKGKRTIQKGYLIDDYGDKADITWFNQPYLTKIFDENLKVYISGKITTSSTGKISFLNPQFEPVKPEQVSLGRISPIYPLTDGINQNWLRKRIKYIIDNINQIEDLFDDLSTRIRNKYELLDLKDAYKSVHFPTSFAEAKKGRDRLGFDELFAIYSRIIRAKNKRKKNLGFSKTIDAFAVRKLIESLPINLTTSQIKSYKEVLRDLSSERQMRRLIQGDVGSGKTIIAVISAYATLTAGQSVIVLAPTTILATQLYDNFRKYLPTNIKFDLITSDTVKKDKESKADLIIGTHALFSIKRKSKSKLGLVIIDEQHKFGVEQRTKLLKLWKDDSKIDILQMTATPIPRTIAQVLFADIDISRLEKRTTVNNIETFVVPEYKRESFLDWLRIKLLEGNKAFWVFPRVESEDDTGLKHAYNKLQESLKEFSPSLLYGKIKEQEKNKIINEFRLNKSKILFSTTVIEVGIDIPDASIIIIEEANMFGLAQLHQLRGRVGRAGQASWCLLFTTKNDDERLKRFSILNDGNDIADYDLEYRGPGEVYGTMQSGLPNLKFAKFSNNKLMQQVKEAVEINNSELDQ